MATTQDFNALLNEARERLTTRKQDAARMAETDEAVCLENTGGTIQALITPSLAIAGGWRTTFIDAHGPIGHSEYRDKLDAVYTALEQNYRPVGG